jgi:hypothetical protein
MAVPTKSKAKKIKLQHPSMVAFAAWRREFETRIIGGTTPAEALKKFRAYFAKTFMARDFTSDEELRTGMLHEIYNTTGIRPFNAVDQRDSTFFSEKLQEIVASLGAFTARVRQRKGRWIPSANGDTFVAPCEVVQVFEDALRVARHLEKDLKKPHRARQKDAIDACLNFLLGIVKFTDEPIMTEAEARETLHRL